MERIGYQKNYRLRMAVPGRKSIEVTFPYEVVEKEARSRGLEVADFLSKFSVIAEYNNFDGVIYTFVPRSESEDETDKIPEGT